MAFIQTGLDVAARSRAQTGNRNTQVAGADGLFYTVQFLAELRLGQIAPKRDGLLTLPDGQYRLDKPVDSDGLVERWSLLPVR